MSVFGQQKQKSSTRQNKESSFRCVSSSGKSGKSTAGRKLEDQLKKLGPQRNEEYEQKVKNTKIFQYYQDDNPDNIPLEFRKPDYMSSKKTQDVIRSSSVSAVPAKSTAQYSMFHQDQVRLS